MGLLSHFSGYEVHFLVRNNTVWYAMAEDKAFCKSVGGGLTEALHVVNKVY